MLSQAGKNENQGNRFNVFVTNGCLFGTYIQGIQQNGAKVSLIDHQLQIKSPIIDIEMEDEFHPYEKNSFQTLIKHLPLMRKIGTHDFSILYHLPVIDYMLYGVLLYLQGNMSYSALDKYITQIVIRGERHKNQLEEIAKKQHVNIAIKSPFENLFAPKMKMTAKTLFSALDIDIKETGNFPSNLFENLFVMKVLSLLQKNKYSPETQKVWQKLGHKNSNFRSILCLKDVLGMANASVIAYAITRNFLHENNKTCVWLSADEYPVFNHYKHSMSAIFGGVTCFSFFPTLLNYVEMNFDGTGQKTLFQYHPNVAKPDTELKSRWDNYYLKILDHDLLFFLNYLLKGNKFFEYSFILGNFYEIFIQDGEPRKFCKNVKKNLIIITSTVGNVRYRLFFANREKIKSNDTRHSWQDEKSYLL